MSATQGVKRRFKTGLIKKLSKPAALVFILGITAGFFLPGGINQTASAKRKSCTDCHKDIKNRLKKEKAHKPAAKSCATCHKRHGFAQKLVLVKEAPELCLDCHKNVAKELEKDNVHAALSEGGCTICHDPHASKEKSLLRKSKGNPTICATCHENHKENLQRGDTHEPYKKKDCSLCHAPHSSSQENLLLAEEKELCAKCHKNAESKHGIPSITEVSCSSCHDPHLASGKNPVIASAHTPFAEGSCDACHEVENGRITHRKNIGSSRVCADCHGETADILTGPGGHLQRRWERVGMPDLP